MIETLTPEQEKSIEKYENEAFAAAYSITPGDLKKAETAIKKMYVYAGLKEPKVYFEDGPLAVQKKINKLAGTEGEFYDFAYYGEGGIEVYWTRFYDFFIDHKMIELSAEETAEFENFKDVILNCSFMVQMDEVCVASKYPVRASCNAEKSPHATDGMAYAWADGFGIYFLNGVEVPEWVVTTPAKKITAKMYFEEKNIEVKREIFRKLGAERFLKITNAKLVDVKNGKNKYSLYLSDLGVNTPTNFLLMKNPSVKGLMHAEVVGKNGELKTVQEALNFRAQRVIGQGEKWNPCEIA